MSAASAENRSTTFFVSWLWHAIGALCLSGLLYALTFGSDGVEFRSLVQWGMLGFAAGTVYWMFTSWIMVVEGTLRHAEYGGTDNRLRRLLFHDHPTWQLRKPLPICLDVQARPGYVVLVSVWENFLGDNRVCCRLYNCYTGESVCPEDADDWS